MSENGDENGSKKLTILGAPTDYGVDRRGVDMGPSAVRYAGLVESLRADGHDVNDAGDVDAPRDGGESGEGAAKRASEAVADRVADATEDSVPVVVGGDHSVSIGTLVGASRNVDDLGVLWFDAHADFNTRETTPSGNVHGMALAAAAGHGSFAGEWPESVDGSNVAVVGVRDLDDGERENLRSSEVTVFTMSDIDRRGIGDVTEDALEAVSADTDALHVSLDMDWLDPDEAPGVGTSVVGGVTYREAHMALEMVSESDATVRSVDLVEVNPVLDESNRTAELGVELIGSLFGRTVY